MQKYIFFVTWISFNPVKFLLSSGLTLMYVKILELHSSKLKIGLPTKNCSTIVEID